MGILKAWASALDSAVSNIAEGAVCVINESYSLSGRAFESAASVTLDMVDEIERQTQVSHRRKRSRLVSGALTSSSRIVDPVVTSVKNYLGKVSTKEQVRHDHAIHPHELGATGLVEDFHMSSLMIIRSAAQVSRRAINHSVRMLDTKGVRGVLEVVDEAIAAAPDALHAVQYGWHSLFEKSPHLQIDQRSVQDIIVGAGYPCESHDILTEDGYILSVYRIPIPFSSKEPKGTSIALFQHGIMDSAFGWVGGEATQSMAFRAHSLGQDVWLSEFRGSGRRRHVRKDTTHSSYWQFSINEHAIYDLPAVVRYILDTKSREYCAATGSDCPSRNVFEVNLVAHSMGAAASLFHVVYSKIRHRPHNVDRLILLSPAGYHAYHPKSFTLLMPVAKLLISLTGLCGIPQFPKILRLFVAKVVEDVRRNPSLMALLSRVWSYWLGGSPGTSPLSEIRSIGYHLMAGVSMTVIRHFIQLHQSGKFQCFDYGKMRNEEVYGTSSPPDLHQYFHTIDIPVHFIMGLEDRVIAPENVLRHYHGLATFRPDLAHLKTFAFSGHVDFILNLSDEVICHVAEILSSKARHLSPSGRNTPHTITRQPTWPQMDPMDYATEVGRTASIAGVVPWTNQALAPF